MNICISVISKNIGNLKKVWKFELYKNNLAGELLPEFRKVTRLLEFDVTRN
jgi:hypothetical protein